MNLKPYIKVVEDFPKEGISFKDVTSLLLEPKATKYVIDQFADFAIDVKADVIVGPDARGFIVGMPISYKLDLPFIPVRKKGKLPRETISKSYDLEYGQETLCLHKEDIKKGARVLIVDDLLATGGTIDASISMLKELGAEIVGLGFVMDIADLNGKKRLEKLTDCEIKILESY